MTTIRNSRPYLFLLFLFFNFAVDQTFAQCGVLDTVSGTGPAGAFSLDKLWETYSGKAISVEKLNGSDRSTSSIGFDGCNLDIPSLMKFANGEEVRARILNDQSGNENDAKQLKPARQPDLIDDPGTGLKVFGFNGSTGLGIADLYKHISGASEFTVIIALKWNGKDSGNNQHIFTAGRYAPSGGAYPLGIFLERGKKLNKLKAEIRVEGDRRRINLYDKTTLSVDEWHILRLVYDRNGAAELWINGKRLRTYSAGLRSLIAADAHGDGVFWGANGNYDRGWNGKLLPPVFYNRALSKKEARSIEENLAEKLGIQLPKIAEPTQQFGRLLNPTGNPIGGGPGYDSVILQKDADHVVTTKKELFRALKRARPNQIVYIDNNAKIDLTGESKIKIPKSVTLASGRGLNGSWGGLLYSNSFYRGGSTPVFETGGKNIRITGLRFRGPSPDIRQNFNHCLTGVALGIKISKPNVEIDNCELYAWDKWAIYASNNFNSLNIHHNYIHHTKREGYGYPVWIGGSGSEEGQFALVEANLIEDYRHGLASSGHCNDWEFRYNVLLPHATQANFDRHPSGSTRGKGFPGFGGRNSHLHHNVVFDPEPSVDFGIARPHKKRGEPSAVEDNNGFYKKNEGCGKAGFSEINNNWFTSPGKCKSFEMRDYNYNGDIENNADCQAYLNHSRVRIHDNHYKKEGRIQPVAIIKPSVTEGVAPLTVTFDGSGSHDQEGGEILWYQWKFGDGDIYGNEKRGQKVDYTFKDPGEYKVQLRVFTDKGVPGWTILPIVVRPESEGYWLSAWVKDGYWGDVHGLYEKRVLVNGTQVWSSDIAGNQGWEHIVVDVTSHLRGKSSAKIALQLYVVGEDFEIPCSCSKKCPLLNVVDLHMYIDDVYLFGGRVSNNGFEAGLDGWSVHSGGFGLLVDNDEVRSGVSAPRLRAGTRLTVPKSVGSATHIAQNVLVDDPLAPPLMLEYAASASAAFGIRKLYPKSSNNAIRIRRSQDDAKENIGFLSMDFDTTAFNAFIGTGKAFLETLYDQSGNMANALQSTTARQPQIFQGEKGNQNFAFDGSQGLGIPGLYDSIAGGEQLTVFVAARWDGTGNGESRHIFTAGKDSPTAGSYPMGLFLNSSDALYGEFRVQNPDNTTSLLSLVNEHTFPKDEWHIIRLVFDAQAKAELWVDGQLITGLDVNNRPLIDSKPHGDGVFWGINGSYDRGWKGKLIPPIVYPRAIRSQDAKILEQNLANHLGLS